MNEVESSTGCPTCQQIEEQSQSHSDSLVAMLSFPQATEDSRGTIATLRHVSSWDGATADERRALFSAVETIRAETPAPLASELTIQLSAPGQHVSISVLSAVAYRNRAGAANPVAENIVTYRPTAAPLSSTADRLVTGERHDPLFTEIDRALSTAARADIAVAFVKPSGVAKLREHLEDFLGSPHPGRLRLLCGDYLDLTDPTGLRALLALQGDVELRVFQTAGFPGFHPKAWIFYQRDGTGLAYIGSSNLSEPALCNTVEWNYKMAATGGSGELAWQGIGGAFERLFQHPATCALDDAWVDQYAARREQRLAALPTTPSGSSRPDVVPGPDDDADAPPEPYELQTPHDIQKQALAALEATRAEGNAAGLVVLATGLGKTWLAAFDSVLPTFKRVLFVAHREEILNQAMATFRRIRPDGRFGRFTGKGKDPTADVLFASIQTLGRASHLDTFKRDAFDYIVVDEFHHAAAGTYRRLIAHFTPRFMLGLTATPERTDGGDLLTLCDDNLVYRADIGRGIADGLLCTFRYWGVPDDVDYDNIPWRSSRFDEQKLTEALATQKRAQNALDHMRQKGGDRTIVFCCSTRHADYMAGFLRDAGMKAVAVHSSESSAPRASSLEALKRGELEAICAVDMLNEGVDVPAVDTVVMLRPTTSAIVWLQQLGRGLRKAGDKVLKVIDYIGNHRTFLIKPLTLMAAFGRDDMTAAEAVAALRGGLELPDGCEVVYDLEAVDILTKLAGGRSKAVDRIRQFYRDYTQRHGERPRAVHAYWERLDLNKLRKDYGGWLGFVAAEGGLDKGQLEVFRAQQPFFEAVEKTEMTKSYKMVLLSAMLEEQAYPGTIAIDKLVEAFSRRAKRSAELMADVGEKHLASDQSLKKMLESFPIPAWTDGKGTGGVSYFSYQHGVFATRDVPEDSDQRTAMAELTHELVELCTARYLDRGPFQIKVNHNKSGDPILMPLGRERYPRLPQGWKTVTIEGVRYKANFAKIAINVVRLAEGEPNRLPEILRAWFGPDAGASGSKHYVTISGKGGQWRIAPAKATLKPRADDGQRDLDASFSIQYGESDLHVVVDSRGGVRGSAGARNTEYTQGLLTLLKRLAALRATLKDVLVDSTQMQRKPVEERRAKIDQWDYPVRLNEVSDMKAFASALGRGQAAVGRPPGAKGGGNSTKRIRLVVDVAGADAAELGMQLVAPSSKG